MEENLSFSEVKIRSLRDNCCYNGIASLRDSLFILEETKKYEISDMCKQGIDCEISSKAEACKDVLISIYPERTKEIKEMYQAEVLDMFRTIFPNGRF